MTDTDHGPDKRQEGAPLSTGDLMLVMGVALGAGALLGLGTARKAPAKDSTPPDDAPNRAAKQSDPGGYSIVSPSVTIAASPEDILAIWEDEALRPDILGEGIAMITDEDGTVHWRFGTGLTAFGPVATRVVHEREGELLVWRSIADEGADLEVKLRLDPAPGLRGTRVVLLVASRREGIARILPDVTKPAARMALKRLKMIAETGEIATSDNRRAA